jgi:hypothetical protein
VDFGPSPDEPIFEGTARFLLGSLCGLVGPPVVALSLRGIEMPFGLAITLALGGTVTAAVFAHRRGDRTLGKGIFAGLALLAIVFGGCLLLLSIS